MRRVEDKQKNEYDIINLSVQLQYLDYELVSALFRHDLIELIRRTLGSRYKAQEIG
jgi:hypothetical protein